MPLAATSLTLSAILKTTAARAGLGSASPVVTGLSPAAQAFAAAATAATAPVVLVVPSDAGVEQMTADARFFGGALLGIPESEMARTILPFPSPEVDPYRAIAPHLDVASARARALAALAQGTARLVVASAPALLPRVSPPQRLLAATQELVAGGFASPTLLGELLADAGFSPEDPVDQHGEFCLRGGVVDFFPAGDAWPVRVEFVGDMIESLRRYDPGTQRSVASLDRAAIVPLRDTFDALDGDAAAADCPEPDRGASVFDYLAGRSARLLVQESEECARRVADQFDQLAGSYRSAAESGRGGPVPEALFVGADEVQEALGGATRLEALGLEEGEAEQHVACQPALAYRGRLSDWVAELRTGRDQGETQLFVAATAGRAERIAELLGEHDLRAVPVAAAEATDGASLLVATGQLSRGFRLPAAGLRIHAEADLFDEQPRERRRSVARSFLSDLRDLKVGDHVVHVDHGIGSFVELRQMAVGGAAHELMELRYAGGDKLFVPVEQLDLIQKYTGSQRPALDRLGGTTWERAKTRVRRAMRDMAQELLRLYAARKAADGHRFSPDGHWQEEFDAAFQYELTPDQQAAVADIKRDMEAPSPMDRLLCGDVGYGKTEVALRAAFKAVIDGKQVALLAPTTVLAFQHLKTLVERFAAFPVRIEMVSRFRSRAEQKALLADLAAGKVDVMVGTHRLLSKDVQFHDLGLLVVDEEQRFGVAHKERIKTLRRKVDVLTMTATPIPRTLNMSLMGIRDMSVIETPPKDRLAIQTNVVKFDTATIARAIRSELERAGQVYFVHNRIESIYSVADMVRRVVPEARLAVAHGQSSEAVLERVMLDFVAREYDVLLSTTIIENGLDIPNVNTIIVNHAERYGLSQLYQLRGRVGRSGRRGVRLPARPPRRRAVAGRAAAAGCHQGVQRSRQRISRGRAGSRDPWRRQPARRAAERSHRGDRVRHVRDAAGADRARAEGRAGRGRSTGRRQPRHRSADRRAVRHGHEPAIGAVSAHGGRPRRGHAGERARGGRGSLRTGAAVRAAAGGVRPDPHTGRPARHRVRRPGAPPPRRAFRRHVARRAGTAGGLRAGAAGREPDAAGGAPRRPRRAEPVGRRAAAATYRRRAGIVVDGTGRRGAARCGARRAGRRPAAAGGGAAGRVERPGAERLAVRGETPRRTESGEAPADKA